MVWPTASIPTYGRGVWLECNGQSFEPDRFPQLYKTLGTDRVPNYQGMFLRGYGSQSYSQNNGEFSSSSTTYSSGSIGQIQGDGMRRLYGGWGAIQFASNDNNLYGNFMKVAGISYFGLSKYELGHGIWGVTHTGVHIPYMEYSISGDEENGYLLNSSVSFFDFETKVPGEFLLNSTDDGLGAFSIGWDSSFGAPTSNEIRSVNVAVKFMIKAK